jgi:hypothetical protein
MAVRRQLSLYVPQPEAAPLEAVRCVLDPVQHALIPAHVTLCRDEELEVLSPHAIAAALAAPDLKAITLTFGVAVPLEGHGVLLPCVSGEDQFSGLRARLLGPGARRLMPHITLAHPRNPRAPGNHLDVALRLPPELTVTFADVNLIGQRLGEPWNVRARHPLGVAGTG